MCGSPAGNLSLSTPNEQVLRHRHCNPSIVGKTRVDAEKRGAATLLTGRHVENLERTKGFNSIQQAEPPGLCTTPDRAVLFVCGLHQSDSAMGMVFRGVPRVVLVTRAALGIGKATSLALASAGDPDDPHFKVGGQFWTEAPGDHKFRQTNVWWDLQQKAEHSPSSTSYTSLAACT